MDKPPTFVGVDVSKDRLDVHLHPSGEHFTVGHDEAGVAALVDRLDTAGVAYAVASVECDSKSGAYTVRLRPGAPAPWRYLEAQVQAWLDAGWRTAFVEGPQFESGHMQSADD